MPGVSGLESLADAAATAAPLKLLPHGPLGPRALERENLITRQGWPAKADCADGTKKGARTPSVSLPLQDIARLVQGAEDESSFPLNRTVQTRVQNIKARDGSSVSQGLPYSVVRYFCCRRAAPGKSFSNKAKAKRAQVRIGLSRPKVLQAVAIFRSRRVQGGTIDRSRRTRGVASPRGSSGRGSSSPGSTQRSQGDWVSAWGAGSGSRTGSPAVRGWASLRAVGVRTARRSWSRSTGASSTTRPAPPRQPGCPSRLTTPPRRRRCSARGRRCRTFTTS